MGPKKLISLVFIVIIAIALLISSSKLVETVEKGTYQIKQAAVTGKMSAKMTPGLWAQVFGDIEVMPIADTFFFTHDNDTKDDVDEDTSMEVRFNDGSLCKISGTLRIIMPKSETDAINLVTVKGHKTYNDVQEKLIKPTVRNVLRATANLMSARDSYSSKRQDFITFSRDQIQNGMYKTRSEVKMVKDLVSGEMVAKEFQVIDKVDGVPQYRLNPLAGTGITLANFEIKSFQYEKKVRDQIAEQQGALMAVQTAKANAEKAEQDKLTIEAQGKAKVATARYEKEQEKIRAVVDAEKLKEVAVLNATRELEVAVLAKKAAAETKAKDILLGQGQAEKKRLIIQADGALKEKLSAMVEIQNVWATAYSNRAVPNYYVAGGGDGESGGSLDMQSQQFMNFINLSMAKMLNVDTGIRKD